MLHDVDIHAHSPLPGKTDHSSSLLWQIGFENHGFIEVKMKPWFVWPWFSPKLVSDQSFQNHGFDGFWASQTMVLETIFWLPNKLWFHFLCFCPKTLWNHGFRSCNHVTKLGLKFLVGSTQFYGSVCTC